MLVWTNCHLAITQTRRVWRALLRRWKFLYSLYFKIYGVLFFLKSQTSLSPIQFVEKYIKIHSIKSVLLDSSGNDFLYIFLFNIVEVDIFDSELGQNYRNLTFQKTNNPYILKLMEYLVWPVGKTVECV